MSTHFSLFLPVPPSQLSRPTHILAAKTPHTTQRSTITPRGRKRENTHTIKKTQLSDHTHRTHTHDSTFQNAPPIAASKPQHSTTNTPLLSLLNYANTLTTLNNNDREYHPNRVHGWDPISTIHASPGPHRDVISRTNKM